MVDAIISLIEMGQANGEKQWDEQAGCAGTRQRMITIEGRNKCLESVEMRTGTRERRTEIKQQLEAVYREIRATKEALAALRADLDRQLQAMDHTIIGERIPKKQEAPVGPPEQSGVPLCGPGR